MPAKQGVRTELLRWVASQTVHPGEILTEVDLNLRLRQFHEDPAMLRRYMIEQGLLRRDPSGKDYRLPEELDQKPEPPETRSDSASQASQRTVKPA